MLINTYLELEPGFPRIIVLMNLIRDMFSKVALLKSSSSHHPGANELMCSVLVGL